MNTEIGERKSVAFPPTPVPIPVPALIPCVFFGRKPMTRFLPCPYPKSMISLDMKEKWCRRKDGENARFLLNPQPNLSLAR